MIAKLREIVSALVGATGRFDLLDAAWERVTFDVPVKAFGPGSQRHFSHYFEGESRVRVESIEAIMDWLLNCQYVTDVDLFNERDLWQHPNTFEQLRRGDCEDFALWAWRKLTEVGIEAEFYVGRVLAGDEPNVDRQHAWVVFRVDGADFLFEPAARSRQQMIRRLDEAMGDYVPHFAVDRQLRTFAFRGCVAESGHERERSRP